MEEIAGALASLHRCGGRASYGPARRSRTLLPTSPAVNPADSVSLLRVLKLPRRGIAKTTVQRVHRRLRPSWVCPLGGGQVRSVAFPGSRSAKDCCSSGELIGDLGSRHQDAPPRAVQTGYGTEAVPGRVDHRGT